MNVLLNVLRRIVAWGDETVHIPGWLIFGFFVFILPSFVIILAWTFPICQSDNQTQCLANIPNVRIIMTITAFGFPTMIGVLYLRFRSLQKYLDDVNAKEELKI